MGDVEVSIGVGIVRSGGSGAGLIACDCRPVEWGTEWGLVGFECLLVINIWLYGIVIND